MLKKLGSNTYYLPAEINIGFYQLGEKEWLMIDTGYDPATIKEVIHTLKDKQERITDVFLTHAHSDHVSMALLLKKAFNTRIYAPDIEKQFIENPHLMGLFVYPGYPFNDLLAVRHRSTPVDQLLTPHVDLLGQTFKIVPLQGHSPNMVGVLTPDNVLFASDAYVGSDYLATTKLLYSYDLKKDFLTKEWLASTDYTTYVPAHGTPSSSCKDAISANVDFYHGLLNRLKSSLETPMTFEQLLQQWIVRQNVSQQPVSHLIAQGCLGGMISYLLNEGAIGSKVVNNIIHYQSHV